MDKGGNFIGWLFVDNTNLSVALVEEGLAKVHFTAERSNYYKQLQIAEENAKRNRRNVSLCESKHDGFCCRILKITLILKDLKHWNFFFDLDSFSKKKGLILYI